MTRHVITVTPETSLSEVADALDRHRIRRLPVLSGGKLVGIVSRSDLVRRLAQATAAPPETRALNGDLQKAIWDEIKTQQWINSAVINLTVKDGVVEVYGGVPSEERRQALHALIESIPGVKRVESHVGLLPMATT